MLFCPLTEHFLTLQAVQRLSADWLMNGLKQGREKCGAKYQRPESTVSKAQTVAAMDTEVSLQLFLCYTFVVLHGWLMDPQYKKKSVPRLLLYHVLNIPTLWQQMLFAGRQAEMKLPLACKQTAHALTPLNYNFPITWHMAR